MDSLTPDDHKKLQEAWNAHREGRLLLAKELYGELLAKHPKAPALLNALATVLMDLGETETAVRVLERACRGEPHVPALYNLARLKQMQGLLGDAGRLYETIIDSQPDFGPAWLNLGLLLRDCGRLKEAARAFKEAERLMPDYPETFNNLGVIMEALGRFKEAESSFLKALSIDGEYFSARYNLACLYHRLERFREAERELKWILEKNPGDPGATYLLQTLGSLPAPERAPTEYVAKTFDDCAVVFEEKLQALEYKTPEMLFSFMRPFLKKGMKILDLGCGTGLGAEYYREFASMLWGMDCSEKMLAIAHQKGLYDRLLRQDILEPWDTDQTFNLIYSSDCMVYFGNLHPVFSRVAKHMAPGGIFAFSVETADRDGAPEDFHLKSSGRFGHKRIYISKCLEKAGFVMTEHRDCTLRKEAGRPVKGLLVMAKPR